jgi:hypothetical protein
VRELLRVRAAHIVPRVASIKPGSARQFVGGTLVSVQWPTADGVLQLDANLGDATCECGTTNTARNLYSTTGTPRGSMAAWEVRLSIVT